MSHVRTVVFILDTAIKESFIQKVRADVPSLKDWPGNISAQAWLAQGAGGKAELVLLSKWNYRTDFEAWLMKTGYQESPKDGHLTWENYPIEVQVNRYKILEDEQSQMEETLMTHVQTAVFTVDAAYQTQLQEKIKRDVASLKAWEGNLSAEGWQGAEVDGKIEFILVSKWADKANFEAWLKRPEHAQSHQSAQVQDVRKHLTRQVASYDLLAD